MRVEIAEAAWLDEAAPFTLAELADLSGLTQTELELLVECQALPPLAPDPAGPRFGAECVGLARAACRLRNDFDLDDSGLALALRLLARVRELEAELRTLRARYPHPWD